MTKFEEKLEILPIKIIQHPVGDTKYYAAVHVKTLIAQADEEIADLKSKLQQQALPVVPECVAEFIDESKGNLSLYGALFFICDNTNKELNNWVFREANQNLFARAWLDGYTVEKPQLFKVVFPNSTSVLQKNGELNSFADTVYKRYLMENAMTEQEIKSIDERYWQFAVPVEDGE
jgi:hypothetical protein